MATTERATYDRPPRPAGPGGRLPAYRPPVRERRREILRGVGSALLTVVIVVGVPVGLLLALGSPIPTTLPGRDVLTAELDPTAVLRIVSILVWLAWAHFVVCLVVEWRSERRGHGLPTHVPLGGGSQLVARRLVASILLLAGTSVLTAPFAADAPSRPAPAAAQAQPGPAGDVVEDARRAAVEQQQAARDEAARDNATRIYYDVAPPKGRNHDSLWDIAERYLGDGRRYKEIFQLNAGREQPDGGRLEQARLIRPGWVLLMPADASGPGLRVVEPPAVGGAAGGGGDTAGTPATPVGDGSSMERAAQGGSDAGLTPWRGAVGGSLLAAGLLASLRRARGARPVVPDETDAEASLRLAADEQGARFLDGALRGLAGRCAAEGRDLPEIYAAALGAEQLMLSLAPARTDAPAPWQASADGRTWSVSREAVEAADVPAGVLAPYPGLACFGTQDGWRVLLDLESAPGLVSVGGDPVTARAVAASVAVELATNHWSDAVRVTLVGFGDELDGLAPGRLRHVDRLEDVLDDVATRLATQGRAHVADGVLRGRARRPDRALWSPDFLVLSAPPDAGQLDRLREIVGDDRRSVGVVTVGDLPGARWRFVVTATGRLNTGPLGLMLDAQLLPVEDYRCLAPLFVAAGQVASADQAGEALVRPLRSAGPAAAALPVPERHLDVESDLPVEVGLLGPVTVEAPGRVEADRVDVLTELVTVLALHPEGVHPHVLSAALWPRGVSDHVRDATLAHAQAWLGRDSAGRPRLRTDPAGRWVLDQDVRCDWQVFRTLAQRASVAVTAGDLAAADRLRDRALSLVTGPAFEGLPSGRYAWLAHTGVEAAVRSTVVGTAHRLADQRLAVGDLDGAERAARAGLRLLPMAEVLWRDLLAAAGRRGDHAALVAVADELYDALAAGRVMRSEPETDALVDELLPGYRRSVA